MSRNGDTNGRETFGQRADECLPRLVRFLALLGARDPEALAQQSIETAWAQRERYDESSKFSTWLFGIARNHARNDRRKQQALATDPELFAGEAAPRGVFTSVVRRELAERLELAVGRLPAAFGEAFVLHHVEGWSFREIGESLGVTESTARVRAHRARHLLREELEDFDETRLRLPD